MANMTVPQIGEQAPAFAANTTQGPVRFPADYRGKWVVLLSHPGAFDAACAGELGALAGLAGQFATRGCALLSFSPDSAEAHAAWVRQLSQQAPEGAMNGVPIASDDGGMIARRYGVVPNEPSATRPLRGVFVIDAQATVRAVLFYPREVQRDASNILRLVAALQDADSNASVAPARRSAPVQAAAPAQTASAPADTSNASNTSNTSNVSNASTSAASVPVYPYIEAEPPARRSSGKKQQAQAEAQKKQEMPAAQPASTQTAPAAQAAKEEPAETQNPAVSQQRPAIRSSLRPVSQSVWDALAEAQPLPRQEQTTAPAPTAPASANTNAGTSAGTSAAQTPAASERQAPLSSFAYPPAKSMPKTATASAAQVKPSAPKTAVSGKPGSSIAEQNRLLLGGLLDKEAAESGDGQGGEDYIILRDFPFNR